LNRIGGSIITATQLQSIHLDVTKLVKLAPSMLHRDELLRTIKMRHDLRPNDFPDLQPDELKQTEQIKQLLNDHEQSNQGEDVPRAS
jgi:hypothetical protein